MHFEKRIHTGKVTYLGISPPAVRSEEPTYLETQRVSALTCDLQGLQGDRHYGYSLKAGGRQKKLYTKGATLRNNRQWMAISDDELAALQRNLKLREKPGAAHIGGNVQIDGLGPVSQWPPLTHLVFSPHASFSPQQPEDVVWVVYAEVLPCRIAGRALAHRFQDPKLVDAFPKAAIGIRGCTGYVDKGGVIRHGWYVHRLTPTYQD